MDIIVLMEVSGYTGLLPLNLWSYNCMVCTILTKDLAFRGYQEVPLNPLF